MAFIGRIGHRLAVAERRLCLAAAGMLLIALGISGAAQDAELPGCAVLTFEAREGVSESQAQMLSDRFAVEFERLGRYRLIARSVMQEILIAQGQSDLCSAAACAVEAGRILHLRYIVYGTIGKLGSVFSVNSFLVDVETGAHLRSATTDLRGSIEEVLTVVMAINAHELLGVAPPAPLTQAFFNISVSPQQARLTLDGQPVSPGMVSIQPNRDYTVTASLPGYDTRSLLRRTGPGTTLNVDLVLQPVAGKPPPKPWDRTVFIGPKVGLSMLSGVLGVELQLKHFGITAGKLPENGVAYGLRYYFKAPGDSWYLAIGGGFVDDDYDYKTEYAGFLLGYRWHSQRGLNFSLGAGVARYEEHDSWYYDYEEYYTGPMLDISLGYFF